MDELERELDGPPASFLYTIPTFQNPTGSTLSEERRRRLAELVRERELPLLEDDPYGLVRFEGESLPSLFELEGGERVMYSSSFSKTIAPGLRVGYAIVPASLTGKLEAARRLDLHHARAARAGDRVRVSAPGPLRAEPRACLRAAQGPARRDGRRARARARGARALEPARGRLLPLVRPARRDRRVRAARACERGRASRSCPAPTSAARTSSARLAFSFVSPAEIDEGVRRLAALTRAGGCAGIAARAARRAT